MIRDGFDLTYLSFGAGVQSTALLALSALNTPGVPRVDVAIFADTGDEPGWVYEHLARMKEWAAPRGVEVLTVQKGTISEDIYNRHVTGTLTRFAMIPLWTRGDDGRAAPLRRQCTKDYKIAPIEQKVRELLGYTRGQHVKKRARGLIGISTDEIQRCKPSRTPWVTSCWPLIDLGHNRARCLQTIRELGLPVPKRSACRFCPYKTDREWRELRESPEEWAKTLAFDALIRDMSRSGMKRPTYLHRSLKPLAEVDLEDPQARLFREGWEDECEGMCGV